MIAQVAPTPAGQPGTSSVGVSGGALPQADGVQAASGGDTQSAPTPPPEIVDSPGWPEWIL
ncbi:hypothetical protein C6A85_26670, partial [Mycobacterium sp. ITM-2017-0098]